MKLPVALVAAALAGCAVAPVEQAPAAPCTYLRFEQAGKVVAPSAGNVTLARAPFKVTYTGPGREPALHVSSKPELANALARSGRSEVWTSLGQGMAGGEGQLFVDDKIEVYRDEGSRKAVTQLVHQHYWPMVREKVEARPLDTAVRMGLNTWWEPAPGAGPRVYLVRSIDSQPVARSKHATLHIVAFGETERVVAQQINIPLLARVRWNACTLRFQS